MRLVRRIFDREISIRDFYFDSVVKWCLQMTNYDSFLSYEKSIQSLKSLITRKQFSPRRWWRQKDIRFWSVNNLYINSISALCICPSRKSTRSRNLPVEEMVKLNEPIKLIEPTVIHSMTHDTMRMIHKIHDRFRCFSLTSFKVEIKGTKYLKV